MRTLIERCLLNAWRSARRCGRIGENDVIIRDRIWEILRERRAFEAAERPRPRRIRLGKRALSRKSLHEAMSIEGVGLFPWLCIDGRAICRINPAAVDEDRGILSGPQQRRQDVDAGRSVASPQRVDDLLPVIVDPSDVNSAEVGGGGIARQRVELDLGREPSRGDDVIRFLPRPEPADLPGAEGNAADCDRDRENAENPFAKSHSRNIAR